VCRHSGEGRARSEAFSAIQLDFRSWFSGCRIKSGMTENYGLSSEEINMKNEENIKKMVFQELKKIAPEADLERIDPSVRFREQFEFDSVDFLNLIMALQKETIIIIAEEDYLKLSTLKGIINYFLNLHQ
jgi:acyl carrier protein